MHIYGYLLQNEYAARVHDLRTYHFICRDIVNRWVYPPVPRAQPLSHILNIFSVHFINIFSIHLIDTLSVHLVNIFSENSLNTLLIHSQYPMNTSSLYTFSTPSHPHSLNTLSTRSQHPFTPHPLPPPPHTHVRWVYPLVPDAQLLPDASYVHTKRYTYKESRVPGKSSDGSGMGRYV